MRKTNIYVNTCSREKRKRDVSKMPKKYRRRGIVLIKVFGKIREMSFTDEVTAELGNDHNGSESSSPISVSATMLMGLTGNFSLNPANPKRQRLLIILISQ